MWEVFLAISLLSGEASVGYPASFTNPAFCAVSLTDLLSLLLLEKGRAQTDATMYRTGTELELYFCFLVTRWHSNLCKKMMELNRERMTLS